MSNQTVLIVEDEYAIAELLAMALSDAGYRVVIAANGRQGLERLAEDPLPDLVITDFMMPVLDGAGLLQTMREAEPQRHIPFVIISSIPEESVSSRISGYAGFVRKPFRLTSVVELVRRVLGARQPPSTA